MRTAQGEASKRYSGHYERRSRGALKGVRVHQRGRTYAENKWGEGGGCERVASRNAADPYIANRADKGKKDRKDWHADKPLRGRLKHISYQECPGIVHATCGKCGVHVQLRTPLESQTYAEHHAGHD